MFCKFASSKRTPTRPLAAKVFFYIRPQITFDWSNIAVVLFTMPLTRTHSYVDLSALVQPTGVIATTDPTTASSPAPSPLDSSRHRRKRPRLQSYTDGSSAEIEPPFNGPPMPQHAQACPGTPSTSAVAPPLLSRFEELMHLVQETYFSDELSSQSENKKVIASDYLRRLALCNAMKQWDKKTGITRMQPPKKGCQVAGS